MTEATIKQVADYFRTPGETLKGFTEQWKALPDADKEQLKAGIGDGTLTY